MRYECYHIGMTTRHLGVRVEEHLHSKKDSAVQKHTNVCQSCKSNKHLFGNFLGFKQFQGLNKTVKISQIKKLISKTITQPKMPSDERNPKT